MKEDKTLFVEKLNELISYTHKWSDIDRLVYIQDEHGEEWVYAQYNNGCQRRVCVSADSCSGILVDFSTRIDSAEWVHGDPDKEIDFDNLIVPTPTQKIHKGQSR